MKEKEIVKIVLDELINRKMLKKNITPQEKTKLVLKQYNKLILSIEKTNAQINRLEKEQKKLFPTSSKTNKVALQEENRIYLYTDETLQNRINELKQISPKARRTVKLKGKTTVTPGSYAKSWSIKNGKKSTDLYSKVAYNKEHYRLTHLLEFGHATRNGKHTKLDKQKKTKEIPHIRKTEDKYKERFVQRLEMKIRR